MTSRRVLNKLAKIHLANMLNCIKIEKDDASSIEEVKSSKIVDDATFDIFEDKYTEIIQNIDDVLLIFGQRDQERAYNFKEQFNKIRKILENKKTMSLYIGKDVDYPPHPLNPQLLYKKVDFRIIDFNI